MTQGLRPPGATHPMTVAPGLLRAGDPRRPPGRQGRIAGAVSTACEVRDPREESWYLRRGASAASAGEAGGGRPRGPVRAHLPRLVQRVSPTSPGGAGPQARQGRPASWMALMTQPGWTGPLVSARQVPRRRKRRMSSGQAMVAAGSRPRPAEAATGGPTSRRRLRWDRRCRWPRAARRRGRERAGRRERGRG